jgi:MFS family permease
VSLESTSVIPSAETTRSTTQGTAASFNPSSLLALMLSAFVGLGVLYGGGGVLWNDVIDAFGISKGAFGFAMSVATIASFPVLLFGGRIADRFDKRSVLMVALAVAVVPALGMIFGSGVAVFALLMIMLNLGVTALDLSNNALAMDFERATRKHVMGPLHASFSVGTLVGPLIVWVVLRTGGDYRAMYALIAIMFASLALFALKSLKAPSLPSLPPEHGQSPLHALHLLRSAAVRDLAIITGISFASELLIAQWVGIFFEDERSYSSTVTVVALSLNGGAMAIGRFGNGPFTAKLGAKRALLIQGALTLMGGVLLVTSTSPAIAAIGCGVAGLGLAGMAPTTLSLVGLANPTAPGAAAGAVLFMGYAGIAIAPFIAGLISTYASTRVALIGIALGGLAVAFISRRVAVDEHHVTGHSTAIA